MGVPTKAEEKAAIPLDGSMVVVGLGEEKESSKEVIVEEREVKVKDVC